MFGFFTENNAVQKLVKTHYDVIFYAEGAHYFQYFQYIFEAVHQRGLHICYLTSQKDDPAFKLKDDNVEVVFSKTTLAFVLSHLKADLVFMTMPDLHQFIYKRSPGVKNYVYVFHALVSTHQQYRSGAFDHYDTVLLAGPHQDAELREAEAIYHTSRKQLLPFGYPLLQQLDRKAGEININEKKILIAPSWYEEGILLNGLDELLQPLLGGDFEIVLRPHPEFSRRFPKQYKRILQLAAAERCLRIDRSPDVWEEMLNAGLLVTDRSGIAFEYAFVRNRPVLFIDTLAKMQNPDFARFTSLPAEDQYRSLIGKAVEPQNLNNIIDTIHHIRKADYSQAIQKAKAGMTYPPSFLNEALEQLLGRS